MGSQTATVEEPIILEPGTRFNEWVIDGQVLSIGYMGSNRAWRAHCAFCGFARMLHEPSITQGYVPRCPSNCGH